MRNGDADKRAEKPEPNRKDSGGTVTDTDEGRQTRTARHEQVGIEEGMLLEKVLERENVLAAYRRVKANSGAAGIDGMTVEDLMRRKSATIVARRSRGEGPHMEKRPTRSVRCETETQTRGLRSRNRTGRIAAEP